MDRPAQPVTARTVGRTVAWALGLLLVIGLHGCGDASDDSDDGTTTASAVSQGMDTSDGSGRVVVDQAGPPGSDDPCQGLAVEEVKAGRFDPDRGGNMPLQVHVADIEGDGTDEVFVGATTGTSPFVETVVAIVDGRLVDAAVLLEVTVGGSGRDGTSFGCVDTDGDGRRELVGLRYRFSGDGLDDSDEVTWWRSPAGAGAAVAVESGTYDPITDRRAIETLVDGTCGELVLVDVSP